MLISSLLNKSPNKSPKCWTSVNLDSFQTVLWIYQGENGFRVCYILYRHLDALWRTRPDTRQDSRGRLGNGRDAKIARNSKIFVTYRHTDLPTDTARCRVACPRLKIQLIQEHMCFNIKILQIVQAAFPSVNKRNCKLMKLMKIILSLRRKLICLSH